MTRVYLYRFPSILRRRWSEYLALTWLVAVLGGLAMGSVVVGRLTQSAFSAFLTRDHASTLTMSTYGANVTSGANPYAPSVEAAIRRLPEVQSVEAWFGTITVPIDPAGVPLPAAANDVNSAASVDGLYFDQDRPAVIKGRMANPRTPDEFVTSALGARLLGFHVGEEVPFGVFTVAQTEQPDFATASVQPVERVRMRLVGIVAFNTQVIEDDADTLPTNLVLTPAFTRTHQQSYGTWYGIRLKPGSNLGVVESRLVALLPPGSAPNFNFRSTTLNRVETALRPESIALGGFGVIAGLAVVGIGIPILSRLTVNSDADRQVLRAVGASPRLVAADTWIGAVAALGLGSFLAAGVSAGLSSLAPLGPVHEVYRSGSPSLDWTVIAAGTLLFTGALGTVSVIMAVRAGRRQIRDAHHPGAPGPSRLAAAAASAGLPVPAVVGTRFALEPGGVHSAVPARSVIGGTVLSVTLVVATVTFASGLRTLVSRPGLYGWNWDYAIVSGSGVPPAAQRSLATDPLVQAWSGYNDVNLEVDGREIPGLGASSSALVGPPILSGRQISGANEVVVGQSTLAMLGKRLGDTVEVGYGSPSTAPLFLPPRPMRIVGTATFPAVAGGSTFAEHTGMGVGVLFSYVSLPPAMLQAITNPDPTQAGPALVFVRYRPGVRAAAARADVERVVSVANRAFASDPAAVGDTDRYEGVQRPAAIVNYQSTGDTPLVLTGGLAAGAAMALALSLVASVRRRRWDLAVLKTLGFTRTQTTATVAAQAVLTAMLALLVGIPVGVAAGRQLWIAFARSIGAVPAPTVPATVAVVGVTTLVVAVLVAVIPGRLAARTPAAKVLRAE